MAAVTRLGLHGGPRGLYGDFSGKAAAAVQMSGTTGFAWTPSGALDVEATLASSTGWDTTPTGALDVEATLSGSTGFTWTPTGNLVDTNAVVVKAKGGSSGKRRPRRYLVQVDNKHFEVRSQAEAIAFFERAAQTVEASDDAPTPTKKPIITIRTSTNKPVKSKAISTALLSAQRRINKVYDTRKQKIKQQQSIDMEIANLLQSKLRTERLFEQDEEDAIIALLLA